MPATPTWAEPTIRQDRIVGPLVSARPHQGPSPLGNIILASACEAIASAPDGQQEVTLSLRSLIVGHYIAGGLLEKGPTERALIAAGLQMVNYDPRRKWTYEHVKWKVERAVQRGMREPLDGNEGDRAMKEANHSIDDPQFDCDVREYLLAIECNPGRQ